MPLVQPPVPPTGAGTTAPRHHRLLAQLSDPHVVDAVPVGWRDPTAGAAGTAGDEKRGLIDTEALLRAAVHTLCSLDPRPDLLLCTGDLTNDGTVAQYRNLARILEPLPMPVRFVVGNHDDRAELRAAFPDHSYLGLEGPCDYVIEDLAPLRVLVMDTLIEGRDGGRLDPAQLEWLDAQLAVEPTRPTVVVLHHPPFAVGIAHMDAIGLDVTAAERLASILRRHPHVERVLCGHLHRAVTVAFGGTVGFVAPSTAHAIALRLGSTGAQGGWTLEPPALALHLWSPGQPLVTHLRPIGRFEDRRFSETMLR